MYVWCVLFIYYFLVFGRAYDEKDKRTIGVFVIA